MVESFNLQTTACFTGHRILKQNFDEYLLIDTINSVLERGYKTFLVGMAKGFDMKCFEVLLTLKKPDVEIIACCPCKNQADGYSKTDKLRYENLLSKADKVIYLSEEYINGCMQIRNRFMVDNSSLLIAYMYAERGGTLYTVNYAKKKKKEIIFI
jgi:uncharacterized phage-like protein YoqJ